MLCTQCQNDIGANDRYCSNCGNKTTALDNKVTQVLINQYQLPRFGNPYTKWWAEIPEKKSFPAPYEWLNQKNTLLVFDNYLALTPGVEKRSKVINFISGTTFSWTLLGGPLVAARSIKDKISNSSEGFDSDVKHEIFDKGGFVWCCKHDAEIWEFQKKSIIGKGSPAFYALYGEFFSISGKIPFLFPLTDTQESMTNPYKKIGCEIVVKATNLSDKEITPTYIETYKNY